MDKKIGEAAMENFLRPWSAQLLSVLRIMAGLLLLQQPGHDAQDTQKLRRPRKKEILHSSLSDFLIHSSFGESRQGSTVGKKFAARE